MRRLFKSLSLFSEDSLKAARFFWQWLWRGRSSRQKWELVSYTGGALYVMWIVIDPAEGGSWADAVLAMWLPAAIAAAFYVASRQSFANKWNSATEALKTEAYARFRELKYLSPDPRYTFIASEATVVHEELSTADAYGLDLTVYARNPAGEYFMAVVYRNSKPFFKHLNKEQAARMLADKKPMTLEL
jgi:hypothetical protein